MRKDLQQKKAILKAHQTNPTITTQSKNKHHGHSAPSLRSVRTKMLFSKLSLMKQGGARAAAAPRLWRRGGPALVQRRAFADPSRSDGDLGGPGGSETYPDSKPLHRYVFHLVCKPFLCFSLFTPPPPPPTPTSSLVRGCATCKASHYDNCNGC